MGSSRPTRRYGLAVQPNDAGGAGVHQLGLSSGDSWRAIPALVSWDDPDRKVPYLYQTSVGYSREILPSTSFFADYIRMRGHDQFLNPNINIGTRVSTARSGRVDFTDPFGILTRSLKPGEAPYQGVVSLRTTKYGYSLYDSLSLSMEKRYSHGWSARGAYSLGYSRGVTSGQNDTPDLQVGSDLNLDEWFARAPSIGDTTSR